MSLSGTVWPIHFPPAYDESLTSWMTRLGLYHCSVPSTFFAKTVKGRPGAWKQDLDVYCHPEIIDSISRKCSTSQSTVRGCIISTYIDAIYIPSHRTSALPRWVSPTRIRRKTNHHYGLKFCVPCLAENPYLKRQWRQSFYVVCPIHKVRMLDSCQCCRGSLSSHRLPTTHFDDFPLDSLAFCDLCGFDYRFSEYEKAIDEEIHLLKSINSIIDQGYVALRGDERIHSHLFFQGLRLIMRGLLRVHRKSSIVYQDDYLYMPSIPANFEVEFLRVNDMRHVLLCSYKLLHDWPSEFILFSKKNKLHYQDWIRPRDLSPAWFENVANMLRKIRY